MVRRKFILFWFNVSLFFFAKHSGVVACKCQRSFYAAASSKGVHETWWPLGFCRREGDIVFVPKGKCPYVSAQLDLHRDMCATAERRDTCAAALMLYMHSHKMLVPWWSPSTTGLPCQWRWRRLSLADEDCGDVAWLTICYSDLRRHRVCRMCAPQGDRRLASLFWLPLLEWRSRPATADSAVATATGGWPSWLAGYRLIVHICTWHGREPCQTPLLKLAACLGLACFIGWQPRQFCL